MTTIAERAAAAAGRTDTAPAAEPGETFTSPAAEPLPDLSGYVPREGEDWDMVPVHIAWLRVRRDIAYIGKGDDYKENGKTKYNFRGYERTVAAFGPITLKHGVSVIPHRVTPSHRDAKSGKGTPMRESTTKITWRVYGPKGDFFEMESEGESLDYADKGTAKAQTIAQRVALLVAGLIPTGAPDSDESNIERGEAPPRTAGSYRDEILEQGTSRQRMAQINYEIKQVGLYNTKVVNEVGDEEELGAFLFRIGQERFAGGGQ
ncbi:ERF family protein [Streptomyces sp. DSM 41524]|uniref:ERF family protein n=1 Tax=Streptomyces asiaticus subsp. ignotus TaxID=3098222 RepID=A0ABU7QA52_9ACTN|nr:ERF family protein [Streptomyces sp. DSM 41524]